MALCTLLPWLPRDVLGRVTEFEDVFKSLKGILKSETALPERSFNAADVCAELQRIRRDMMHKANRDFIQHAWMDGWMSKSRHVLPGSECGGVA